MIIGERKLSAILRVMKLDDADDRAEVEYDDFAAQEYLRFARETVRAAYAAREKVGEMDRGAYYDTTTYAIRTAIDPRVVRDVLSSGDGKSMASYGSFGGYSTIGRVEAGPESGTVLVESVYHIGD